MTKAAAPGNAGRQGERIVHPIGPVFDGGSRVLILGSMPSPVSRRELFYYANPTNRFWRVMAALAGSPLPEDNAGRRELALAHGIALWDVLASCSICGAADSTIKDPVANDIAGLLQKTDIKAVFTTGGTAYRLYRRLCMPDTALEAAPLFSTSAANARMSLQELTAAYSVILEYL